MSNQHFALRVDDAHLAAAGNLEGLVVRAVLLGLLRHQADVADVAHGRHVEGAVLFAVFDDGLVNPRVTTIRDQGLGVMQLAVRAPHLPGGADRGGHRRVDDHVTRHVEVGNALVRVDHRQGGPIRVHGIDIRLDLPALGFGQCGCFCIHVADAVIRIDADSFEECGMFLEDLCIEDRNGVPENDGIRDLHHRCLDVQREQNAHVPGRIDLGGEKLPQPAAVHVSSVDNFVGEYGYLLTQHD